MRGSGENDNGFEFLDKQTNLASLSLPPDDDKSFNLLISRVACIGKLQHKSVGYSGPLSRQLLCFRSLVYEVRSALRDQMEVVLASMLLSGSVDRERKDWSELSIK